MIDWIIDGLDVLVDGLLGVLVGGAALGLGAIAEIIIKIDSIIDRKRLKEEMKKKGIKNAVLTRVDKIENVVQLKDLETETQYAVKGNGISNEIKVGIYI